MMTITNTAAVAAGLAPLAFSQALGGKYIDFLRQRYMGQYIREDGPQSHLSKAGTPTAGGVLMLAAFVFGLAVVAVVRGTAFLSSPVILVVAVTLVFGLLGFVDDYLKISKKKNKGVSGYTKLLVQILVGIGLVLFAGGGRKTRVPFGPFMLVGALIGIFVGGPVASAYTSLTAI